MVENGRFIPRASYTDEGREDPEDKGLTGVRAALMPTLLCAAASLGDLAAIEAMVSDGAAVHHLADYDGRTALHLAAAEGHLAIVNFLLTQDPGLDVSVHDRFGKTPLLNAVEGSHTTTVALLCQAGAALGVAEQRLASILCELVSVGNDDLLACYAAGKTARVMRASTM